MPPHGIDPVAANAAMSAWGSLILSFIGWIVAIVIALIGGYFAIQAKVAARAAHDKADTNGCDIRQLNQDVKSILTSMPNASQQSNPPPPYTSAEAPPGGSVTTTVTSAPRGDKDGDS